MTMTNEEIQAEMDRMKEEGKSGVEIGYFVTSQVYGPEPSSTDLALFSIVLSSLRSDEPEDEFLIGANKWLQERIGG